MLDLTRRVNDVGFAFRLATFMTLNDTPTTVRDLRTLFPDDFPSSVQTFYAPRTSFNPAYFAAKMPSGVLILIAGANQWALQHDTALSYDRVPDNLTQASCNPYFWSLANTIKNDLIVFGAELGGNVRIAGHSLGGAVAAALGYILDGAGTNPNVQTLTLGAPRMGIQDWCTRLESLTLERWFNDVDPISIVPFHMNEAPIAYFFSTQRERRAWSTQTNPRSGRSIDANGVISIAFEPTGDMGPTEGSLINWITQGITGTQSVHSIFEYARRLRIASDAVTPQVTLRARAAANETPVVQLPAMQALPVPYTPPTASQIERSVMATRPSVGAAVAAADARRLPLRRLPSFRAVRQGGQWLVMYEGEIIDVGPGKRTAKNKARHFNRVARTDQVYVHGVPVAVQEIADSAFVS